MPTVPSRAAALVCAAALAGSLSACSWFGGNDNGSKSTSVFDVQPGQCFTTPAKVKAELSNLNEVPCTSKHTEEAYAVVAYQAHNGAGQTSSGATSSGYPGSDVLDTYAKGVCAQRFTKYVGVDYLDSTLYYTYLLPSARSWEQNDDRNVTCFVTTTGGTLTKSVKNSRK